MPKKKIIFVITKGNFGGAQRYVFDLASHLDTERFDVAVVVGEGTTLKEKLQACGIRVVSLPNLQRDIALFADVKTFFALFSLFRRERPDVIHLNSSKAGGLGALAARLSNLLFFLSTLNFKLSTNIVFTVHGFAFYENRPWIIRTAIKYLSWFTILFSHATIILNNRDMQAFSGWPAVRNTLRNIKLGIGEIPAFGKQEALLKLKTAGMTACSGPLIGVIAELHRNKGLQYLIEALALLPATISLCIIGNGEERENLERLAHERGVSSRIFFAGFLDGASRYVNAFDLFALPSIKEGTPYVLLEAGSQAVPVVAADVGGIGEVIVNNQTGFLVPPKNPALLAESIRYSFAHPEEANRYGEALRKKVETEFSLERMLSETISVYQEN